MEFPTRRRACRARAKRGAGRSGFSMSPRPPAPHTESRPGCSTCTLAATRNHAIATVPPRGVGGHNAAGEPKMQTARDTRHHASTHLGHKHKTSAVVWPPAYLDLWGLRMRMSNAGKTGACGRPTAHAAPMATTKAANEAAAATPGRTAASMSAPPSAEEFPPAAPPPAAPPPTVESA